MVYDLASESGCDNYDLLTQTVIPRPIAWILSENADGGLNLAPFSYFNIVSSRPVLFSVSIGRRPDGSLKDTRQNLVDGRPCVIHLPGCEQIDAVNDSAKALASGVSEVEALGLETVPFDGFLLPRLSGVSVAFGGRLRQEAGIEGIPQALLIIEATIAYIADRVQSHSPPDGAQQPTLDPTQLNPLSRLGRTEYSTMGGILTRSRA